jgi:hypothetical protein
MSTGSHALLSPSSAHRWSRCPGSVALTKDAPRTDTEASLDGTKAHDIAAWALREGKPVSKHPECPADWVRPLQGYVDRCNGLNAEIWRVEQTLTLDPILPGQFGSTDFWGYLPEYRRLHVVDLKFGLGEVVFANYSEYDASIDAPNLFPNEQLLLYGFGAYSDASMFYEVDEIVLAIDQPRREHFSSITLTKEQLLRHAYRLGHIGQGILKADKDGTTMVLRPGERQCRWCPIRGTCQARADWHLDTFKEALDMQHDNGGVATTHVHDMARWLAQFGDMEQWMHDVREEATRRLKSGIDVGGWKLVEGRARRVWNENAGTKLPELLGEKAWKSPELIGITEAEKILGKKTPVMEEITTKMPGAPTLASPDDKRPAMRLSAADDFTNDADMLG